MADETLRANLSSVARWDEDVAGKIMAATGPSPLKLTPSRSGALTALYHTTRLHSQYDPRKEAERIVAQFSRTATLIVLGFGAGWIPECMSTASPETVTVVFEPSREALRAVLARRDFRPPLERGALRFATTPMELRAVLKAVHLPAIGDGATIHPLAGRAERDEDRAAFASARQTIRSALAEIASELGTIRTFAFAWLAHTVANSYAFSWRTTGEALAVLTERLSVAQPRTVVGAGPSLTSTSLAGRPEGPLVAVDTALPALTAMGYLPDIVVSIDPQGWSSLHFRRRLPARTVLVADIGVTPRVLTAAPRTVLMSSNHPLHRLMERHGFPLLSPSCGGETVTEMAIALAGSTDAPTHLIGIDGAYPRGETYARGTYHHTIAQQRGRRLASVETFFARTAYARTPSPKPDDANRPVFAPPAMEAARERILRLAESPQSMPFRLPPEAPPPDATAFWRRHAAELRSAADRLSDTRGATTPEIVATIGPHGVAHLPILAALRHRIEREGLFETGGESSTAIAAGGGTAVAATLRTAARLVEPDGRSDRKQVLSF